MVKEINKGAQISFVCEACNFKFASKSLASQCEEYCTKYKSCNVDLAKKAIR